MKIYNNKKLIESYLKDTIYSYQDYQFIINHFKDEKSKNLFFYKLMADFTQDPIYNLKLIYEMFENQSIADKVQLLQKSFVEFLIKDNNYLKNIVIIGINEEVIRTLSWLSKDCEKLPKIVKVYDYFDNVVDYKTRENYTISCDNINNMIINKEYIYIITNPELIEFKYFLKSNNISNDNIFVFFDYNYKSYYFYQYFGEQFIKPCKDEVFIDGGAADLETTIDFIGWCNCDYKKIYSTEPSKEEYQKCLNNIQNRMIENIELLNIGLWSKKAELRFENKEFGASTINDEGNDIIKVDSIDNLLNGEKATFIKLDIEGAEKEALHGAINTIKKFKPKLAISVYHKKYDSIELALYILKINEKYNLRLRHYNLSFLETVLYAY